MKHHIVAEPASSTTAELKKKRLVTQTCMHEPNASAMNSVTMSVDGSGVTQPEILCILVQFQYLLNHYRTLKFTNTGHGLLQGRGGTSPPPTPPLSLLPEPIRNCTDNISHMQIFLPHL